MSTDPAMNQKLEKLLIKASEVADSTDHISRLLDRVTAVEPSGNRQDVSPQVGFWAHPKAANFISAISVGLVSIGLIFSAKAYIVSKEALEDVQRAFVSYSTLKVDHDKDLKQIEVTPTWENTGTTPARSFVHYYGHLVRENGTKNTAADFEPSDDEFIGPTARPDYVTKTSVQPKGSIQATAAIVSDTKVFGTAPPMVGMNIVHNLLFFYGWGAYYDVFGELHVTEFCNFLASAKGVPPQTSFEFLPCKHHNCDDVDCTDLKQITALYKKFTDDSANNKD